MWPLIFGTASTPIFLRILHACQLTLSFVCFTLTIVAFFLPFRSFLLFSLLYSLIASSALITAFVFQERVSAAKGTLPRSYSIYQCLKIGVVVVIYFVGFQIFASTYDNAKEGEKRWFGNIGYQGLKWREPVQDMYLAILGMHALNWAFLSIGLLYAAFVPHELGGQIRLDDSAQLPKDREQPDVVTDDETTTRKLQVQGVNSEV